MSMPHGHRFADDAEVIVGSYIDVNVEGRSFIQFGWSVS
jgi:hypothetical protein